MAPKKPATKLTKNELFAKIRKADICEIAHKLKDCCKDGSKRADEARFAIFLGAGASVAAGVKTAAQMMDDFREKILTRDCPSIKDKKVQEKWLKNNVLRTGKGNEYSQLFETFERTPRGRQNYISKLLKDKQPTFGYAMLASLIARGFINTVLTTNFDDLAFIACTKFSGVRPVIYAYGIMATEMKFSSPHPKILKMHGDYLYSALANTEVEMSQFNQDPNMGAQVTSALDEYELIVCGYGGADNSVMNILENYPANKEFYWCYKDGEIPDIRVLRLIEEKNGSLIKIEGFDQAMYDIYKIVDFELDEVLASYEQRRIEILEYIEQFDKKYPTKILEEVIDEVKQETIPEVKTPSSWFEFYMAGVRAAGANDISQAEKYYRKVIELKPDYSSVYNSLGILLWKSDRNEEAEEAYRIAIRLKPDFAEAHYNLGILLDKGRQLSKKAEEAFRRAIEIDPNYEKAYNNLGVLLSKDPRRTGEAQEAYFAALNLEPEQPTTLLSLATLYKQSGDIKSMKFYAEKAKNLLEKDAWYLWACYYAIVEKKDECLLNLSKAFKETPFVKTFVRSDPEFDSLRDDPRFGEMVDF